MRRRQVMSGWSGMRAVAAVAVLVAVVGAPAWAQAPTVRRVEFDEAVKLALERNPTVAASAVSIAEADALLRRAKAVLMPSAGMTVTNVTLDSKRGFSGGTTQPQNQFAFGGSLSMPLVAATSRALVDQARDRIDLATANASETRRQIAMLAAQAYLTVITAVRQVEVDSRALESARAHLDYADKRLEGGVGSRLNQLRAAQAVSDDQARLENTRLGLRRAQEALGVLLAENGPVDAGGAPAFEDAGEAAETEWMASRPDLQAQAVAIRSAERVIRDTWKVWVPTAAVSFDPQLVTPAGLFQPSRTWRLVFSVSQPLFQAGVRAEKALNQVTLRRAEFARSALEIQARSEIRVARETVASQERVLTSARLAAQQANEVLRISSAAFEVGATTNLEVIDAQRSARDADTAATQAEDAVRRARLDVLVALGRFPK